MPTPDPTTQQPGAPATGKPSGPAPPPVVTPPPAPPAAPPAAAEPPGEPGPPDYKKKFQGLQAVHQDLQGKHKNTLVDKDALTTQMTELQGSLESVRGEIDSLKTDRDEGVVNLEQVRAELVDYKLWERKLARIRQTAPHLAQFEKFITVELEDALLVEPSTLDKEHAKQLDAAIDAAIADFSKVMGDYVDQSVKAQHAGVVPPSSPGRGGEPSLDSLYELAISKAGTDEYAPLMEQYEKLAAKQEGTVDSDGYWRPLQTQAPMP